MKYSMKLLVFVLLMLSTIVASAQYFQAGTLYGPTSVSTDQAYMVVGSKFNQLTSAVFEGDAVVTSSLAKFVPTDGSRRVTTYKSYTAADWYTITHGNQMVYLPLASVTPYHNPAGTWTIVFHYHVYKGGKYVTTYMSDRLVVRVG